MSADRDKISTGAQQAASVCIYSLRHGTRYKYRNNSRPLALTFPALPPSGPICDASGRLEGAAVWHNEARHSPQRMDWGRKNAFRECHDAWLKKSWKLRSVNEIFPWAGIMLYPTALAYPVLITSLVMWTARSWIISYYASKSETCFSLLVVGGDAEGWSVTERAGRFIRLSLWQQFMQCKTFWRLVLYESS